MNPSLLTAEGMSGLVFLGFIAITMAGALFAIRTANLIRSVMGLALCLIGVAGLYYYLNSPFVALMQILIYVGAVCIVIILAIMLAEPEETRKERKRNPLVGSLSLLAAGVLVWALASLGTRTTWESFPRVKEGSVEDIGVALLTTYSMIFELIALILVTAIIGSIVLARAGRDK